MGTMDTLTPLIRDLLEWLDKEPRTHAEVMDGWFKSDGHCRNLMNPGFKEVGVAEYDTYWVQEFGGREAFSEEQQRLIKSGRIKIIQRSTPAQ